jgi:hypothetical protein
MSTKNWQRKFEEPIPLPSGGKLVTLFDAIEYIQTLSAAEQRLPQWKMATQALLVVNQTSPSVFARTALMLALYPRGEGATEKGM